MSKYNSTLIWSRARLEKADTRAKPQTQEQSPYHTSDGTPLKALYPLLCIMIMHTWKSETVSNAALTLLEFCTAGVYLLEAI